MSLKLHCFNFVVIVFKLKQIFLRTRKWLEISELKKLIHNFAFFFLSKLLTLMNYKIIQPLFPQILFSNSFIFFMPKFFFHSFFFFPFIFFSLFLDEFTSFTSSTELQLPFVMSILFIVSRFSF